MVGMCTDHREKSDGECDMKVFTHKQNSTQHGKCDKMTKVKT